MKSYYSHQVYSPMLVVLIGFIFFAVSCAKEDLDGGLLGPNYCLKFTENQENEYNKYERVTVSSSAQTIELSLKKVKGKDMPYPNKLFVRVCEWDESRQTYDDVSIFDTPADFYQAYTEEENGELKVQVKLTENNDLNERRILLFITSDIVYHLTYQVGAVEIIQDARSV